MLLGASQNTLVLLAGLSFLGFVVYWLVSRANGVEPDRRPLLIAFLVLISTVILAVYQKL